MGDGSGGVDRGRGLADMAYVRQESFEHRSRGAGASPIASQSASRRFPPP
jgi:hypothetical protein